MNNANSQAAAPSPAIDDWSLVQRVRGGDGAAFELLMRRHNRRLYRVARAMLRDAAEAEDAVQEAYFSAYQRIDAFRGDAALATWLSRLVSNECLTRLRRQARRDNIVPIVSAHAMSPPGDDMPLEEVSVSKCGRCWSARWTSCRRISGPCSSCGRWRS